jgi:hypothetical protein
VRFDLPLLEWMKQMRQMTASSHAQALGNPTHRNGCLGPQSGGQSNFERVTFAPARHLLLGDSFGRECLGNQALGFGLLRLAKFGSVLVIGKDSFLVVAAIHRVVDRAGILETQLPRPGER